MNAFNGEIGSPANGYGRTGTAGSCLIFISKKMCIFLYFFLIKGFASYSDICWFKNNNYFITDKYDEETCSPYLHAATEWISYENERSLECKTKYVKAGGFGGVMIFSLNTDDTVPYCSDGNRKFPLIEKVNSILFQN